MKRQKNVLSIVLSMLIVFSVILIIPIQASALSENDIVSWFNSKNGTTINDGGTQCVAAFNSYLRLWGITNPISKYPVSYAYQIFNYNAPDGWQKISGSGNYQVGDVVVWNSSVGSGCGHVGMVYSTDGGTIKIFDQNYVQKNVCGIHVIAQTSAIRGVFRPPLSNEPDHNPIGALDSVSSGNGIVNICGWAFDNDDKNAQLNIHVYIGGEAGSDNTEGHSGTIANGYRSDVNDVYGCGAYHGFSATIPTSKIGIQEVYVYAINVGKGNNVLIGHGTVNIIKEIKSQGVVYTLENDKYVLSKADTDLEGFIAIPNEIEGKTVYRVAKESFINCSKIESVKIPDNAYRIATSCFKNCSNLKSIIIPKSTTEIGQDAFENCTSLNDIFYEGTENEWNSIQNDSNLENNINIHFNYEFEKNLNDSNLVLSGYYDSAQGGVAILDCNDNVSGNISIPTNFFGIPTARIALRAFENCTKLESVVVPNSIKRIGQYAFANCEKLKAISLAGSITSMGTNVFENCKNLENIYYEKEEEDWNKITFDNGFNVNVNFHYCCYLMPDTNAELSFYSENDYFVISDCNEDVCGNIVIPREIYGVSVKRIGVRSFDGCSLLESVEIPNDIYRVGQYCFADCTNLKSVSFAGSINGIGVNIFDNCSNLQNLYYEKSEDDWNKITFDDEFDINATIHYNSYHICNTNALLSIYPEDTYCVISGCNKDVSGSIIIPKEIYGVKVGRIALRSFENCELIESVVFQNDVFRLGQYCFANCINLKTVYLPSSITGLGSNVFINCEKLKNLYYEGSENNWNQITIDGEIGSTPVVCYNSKANDIYSFIDEETEPTTETEPVETQPYTGNTDSYVDKDGKVINLAENIERAADDNALTGISNEFKNLQILGVQKKNDNSKSIRFVSVLNSAVAKDAEDYGYIVVGSDSIGNARSIAESFTLDTAPEKNVFSCKGSENKISGDYGKYGADTKYKYVTFSVNNIGSYSVAAVFYVKDSEGNVFYAPYTNSAGSEFKSCSVNWEALK